MAELTYTDKMHIEKLLGMSGGYVLNFSNRTFSEFVQSAVQRNIYDKKYLTGTDSKANQLRGFFKVENNAVVGDLLEQLLDYATTVPYLDEDALKKVRPVVERLKSARSVADIDAIAATTDDRNFEALAKSVREAIENNAPQTGLDRLHTFVVRYVRQLCASKGIQTDKMTPLHSMFGLYRNYLNQNKLIKSKMTDKILKLSVDTLDAFNNVRNENSFAHDNEILNYDESLFIFNHVCALVRLLQTIEQQNEAGTPGGGS